MYRLLHALTARSSVADLLLAWEDLREDLLEETLTIQAIPAPTFAEQERAAYVERRFQALGLADVVQDDLGNVYGRTPGDNPSAPALLISAHLDTVFPAETDLTARREETRIYGPGVGDNSLGLAAMIALAEQISRRRLVPPVDIRWVATVREEGLGNLDGMRRACDRLGGQIGLAIVLEGMGLGRVYHAGLGVRRLRVVVKGPGGHSWLHNGRPSAIHHLLRMGAALVEEIQPPSEPRSTFNIGLISGGVSINTRAPEASLSVDLRSVDGEALAGLEESVRSVIRRYATPSLEISTEVIGDRPSAALPVNHPLVQAAIAALDYAGFHAPLLEIGSTDANILLANGIPTVCIGITTGGDAHTIREHIETTHLAAGMRQLTLLALLAAEHIEAWSDRDQNI